MSLSAELPASPLARYLLLACTLLIAYASLHPLSGWSAAGVDPLAFLVAPAPRYIVRLEVLANVVGYAPFGFLAVLALHPRLRGPGAVAAASAAAVLLSFTLEALQSYLPARTPSNIDFAANCTGGIAGALLGGGMAELLLVRGRLKEARYALFASGRAIDAGLVLLALWLFTQLDPQTLLFGVGDLRPLLDEVPSELHAAEVFIRAEALVAGANTLVIGMLVSLFAVRHVRAFIAGTIAIALLLHAAGYALFFGSDDAFNWLTPGAWIGLGGGLAIALGAAALPKSGRLGLCAMAIMAAAIAVNIAPSNPYLADVLATWQQGYFEHFVGVTGFVSALWPFAALAYVVTLGATR